MRWKLGFACASLVVASVSFAATGTTRLDGFRSLYLDGCYRQAIAEGQALLARDVPNGSEATLRTAIAASWLDEGLVARRAALLEARVLCAYYDLLLAAEGDRPELAEVPFYRALAEVASGADSLAMVGFTSLVARKTHPRRDASRTWLRVSQLLASGDRDLNDPALAPGTNLEAALAATALGRPLPPPTTLRADAADPRAQRITSVVDWVRKGEARGDSSLFAESELRTPVAFAGPPDGRTVPLHDPYLLLAYARGCLDRASAALPAGATGDEREQAYYFRTRGRIEVARGHFDAAAEAFRKSPETQHLAALCDALAAGDPTRVVSREASTADPKTTFELVSALLSSPSVDWTPLAPIVSSAMDRWEVPLEGKTDGAALFRLRSGRWAAAAAWLGARDPARSASFAAQAYDPAKHGNLRANPPLWLPEYVLALMQDVNNQTLVLRAVSETARSAPTYWGAYDALQGYFIHRFVDSPQSIRR